MMEVQDFGSVVTQVQHLNPYAVGKEGTESCSGLDVKSDTENGAGKWSPGSFTTSTDIDSYHLCLKYKHWLGSCQYSKGDCFVFKYQQTLFFIQHEWFHNVEYSKGYSHREQERETAADSIPYINTYTNYN